MAGQQAIKNFLQQPAAATPGKAPATNLIPARAGKGAAQQQAAQKNEQHQLSVARQQQQLAQGEEARADRAMKRQQEAADQEAQQVQKGLTLAGAVTGKGMGGALSSIGDRVGAWADNVPTPGGIALILAAIFVFLWAIVPVNGSHTRLELLWLTFMGRTSMATAPDAGTDIPIDPNNPIIGIGGGEGIDLGNVTSDIWSYQGFGEE